MDENVKDRSVDEQFALLRMTAEDFGILHEAQVQQLHLWFLGSVDNDFFKDYKIGWSHERKEVEYRLIKPNMHKAPADLPARFEVLHESIKWLLGDDYRLRVANNSDGKVIYDSEPLRGKQKRRKRPDDAEVEE